MTAEEADRPDETEMKQCLLHTAAELNPKSALLINKNCIIPPDSRIHKVYICDKKGARALWRSQMSFEHESTSYVFSNLTTWGQIFCTTTPALSHCKTTR